MNKSNNELNAVQLQVRAEVRKILNLTPEKYDAVKTIYGRAFLQDYISPYPDVIDEIIETEAYWSWWEKNYLLRDEAFLKVEDIHFINTQILGFMYSIIHNPYTLTKELQLDHTIFDRYTLPGR